MKPIEGLAAAIDVVRTREEFVAKLGALSRSTLSDSDRSELRAAWQENDYDTKFDEAAAALDAAADAAAPLTTRLDPAVAVVGDRWSRKLVGMSPLAAAVPETPRRPSLSPVTRRLRHRFGAR